MNEIVSTHGYSQNQIIVWKHPTMTKLATLTGHTLRVLYLAVSPDGQTIVTGAGESATAQIVSRHLPDSLYTTCVSCHPCVLQGHFTPHVLSLATSTPVCTQKLRAIAYTLTMLPNTAADCTSCTSLCLRKQHDLQLTLLWVSAGDETLRFWNVFPGPKSQGSVNDSSVGSMMRTLIR